MSIFDAPSKEDLKKFSIDEDLLESCFPVKPETDLPRYYIYFGKYGGKLKKLRESDCWNTISFHWEKVKNKLKTLKPEQYGFYAGRLCVHDEGFPLEFRTNVRIYKLVIIGGPGEGFQYDFFFKKMVMHYADQFKRQGNYVVIFRSQTTKYNSWIKIAEMKPWNWDRKPVKVENALILLPPSNLMIMKDHNNGSSLSTNLG